MKNLGKKVVSLILVLTMALTSVPGLTALAADQDAAFYTLENSYLTVTVNGKNGGFQVRTLEGDKLVKDDNNKNLLFPDDEYDTSFTSIRVTRNGQTADYIFGRKYADSTPVESTKESGTIRSVWSVDGLVFTQTLTLAGSGTDQHGMVRISYSVRKADPSAADAKVELRILMDTALGYQDWAIYELSAPDVTGRVEQEKVIERGDKGFYSKSFFAYDDFMSPTVTAFTVNAAIGNVECVPNKVAFGHWNNLASTVFDFTPNPDLTFTNPYNVQYLTADSAYALYFDAKSATAEDTEVCATYYGVYSNEMVEKAASVSVNVTMDKTALELAEGNKTYVDDGKFSIETIINNFDDGNAVAYDKVLVAVYPAVGVTVYDDNGTPVTGASYVKPYTKIYTNLEVGRPRKTDWSFSAQVGADSHYRKIEFKVFDISEEGASPDLLVGNLLGAGSAMLLCPGGDGKLPSAQFTSGTPEIIYNQGTRNVYLTGTDLDLLNMGVYDLFAVPADDTMDGYQIPDSDVSIDTAKGTVHVILTETLPVGHYRLEFRGKDGPAGDIVTAPALAFTVSDDPRYKNEGYAVVAVVKTGSGDKSAYSIQAFPNEPAYEVYQKGDPEILFELRGAFELKKSGETITQAVAVSRPGGDAVVINNCFDLVDGSLTVYQTDDKKAVKVDVDGELLTSGVRSPVWDGVAAFTTLENGKDYGLRTYEYDGEPKAAEMSGKEPIMLMWPSAAGLGQELAGFIFNFEYAELGIIDGKEDADPQTMVAAFRAKMDLGFIIPGTSRGDLSDHKLSALEQAHLLLCSKQYSADDLRYYQEQDKAAREEEEDFGEPELNVEVENILFGGGQFIGFSAEVEIGLPSYSPALPQMSGKLNISTIGNWAVGFLGKGKMMEKLEMEFEIQLKGAPDTGAPVPDKLYFYIAGFVPGINVDGFGVLWIQGGGGGIDNLYDTIFGTSALPPLTILLSVKVAILQIIEARADLSISLRGVGIKLTEGKVGGVQVLNSARLKFDWYPEFYFLASVNASILGIINGAGYIVVENDGFFEFYLRVQISIPEDVPLVGGIQVGGADVGASSERLWGNIEVLGIGLGVVYYWGGSVSFGNLGAEGKPTYPELLAMNAAPVYSDPVTGRQLYAAVGTNVRFLGSGGGTALFENALPGHKITIAEEDQLNRDKFTLTLGSYDDTDVMITIDYPAGDANAAEAGKEQIKISNQTGSYPLTWLDADKNVDDPDNASANAYYRGWNEETQRASVTVTFSKSTDFGKAWTLNTPMGAEVGLYGVEALPELTGLSATHTDGQIAATLTGTDLMSFESVSFFAVDAAAEREDALVYKTGTIDNDTSLSVSFALPASLPSGSYYLKAVATKSGELHSTVETESTFDFTNAALPAAPPSVAVANGGDHFIRVNVPQGGNVDGYYVNVYEVGAGDTLTLADGSGMFYEAAKDDSTTLLTGGQYTYRKTVDDNGEKLDEAQQTTSLRGLFGGRTYRVGVSAYRNQKDGSQLFSEEALSEPLLLNEPRTTIFQVASDRTPVPVTTSIGGTAETATLDTYVLATDPGQVLTLTLTTDAPVIGAWTLDEGAGGIDLETGEPKASVASGTVDTATQSIRIPLNDLAQGGHTLTFTGRNAQGDGCRFTYSFAVDATPPKLIIGAPLNGAFFQGDSVTVTGVTDPDAVLSVSVNGEAQTVTQPQVGPDGTFTLSAALDGEAAVQELVISAADAVGNIECADLILMNEKISAVKRLVLQNEAGEDVTNKSLGNRTTTQAQLTLLGELDGGGLLDLSGHPLVAWEALPVCGTAEVDDSGGVTIGAHAAGIVSAKLPVADGGSRVASTIFGATNSNGDQPGAPDYTELETILAQAKALSQSDYTAESWSALAAALAAAETVAGKDNATQKELDAAANALRTAIQNLQRKGGSSSGPSSGSAGALITVEQPPAAEKRPNPSTYGVIIPATTVNRSGLLKAKLSAQDVETALKKARSEAERTGKAANGLALAVDLSGIKAGFKTFELTLSKEICVALVSAGITRLDFRTTQLSLSLDLKALEAVLAAAEGDVILQVVKLDGTAQFSGPAYDVTLTSGGREISSLGQGYATLAIYHRFPAETQGDTICLAYVGADGQPAVLPVSGYESESGAILGRSGHLTLFGVESVSAPEFEDINGHWAQADIRYTVARGLLNGTGGGRFSPDLPVTRGMFVTVLHRLAGCPEPGGESQPFADVPADAYYAPAVAWASAQGVVKGTGEHTFDPDRPVTRQEMAVILTGYAGAVGDTLFVTRTAAAFADEGEVAPWAAEAVRAMQQSGLLTGKDGNRFDPAGTASRAEAATLLRRYVEFIALPEVF